MKFFKPLLFVAVSVMLSGCYTQLQYSQRMNRISQDAPRTGRTYSWDGEEKKRPQQPRSVSNARAVTELPPDTLTNYEEGYDDGYFDATEDAFYYRDYAAAEWYARHGFGHFSRFYPSHYGSVYNGFYHDFGYPYYHDYYYPRSHISLRFHFGFGARHYYGSPYYWSRIAPWHYWDPFYASSFGYGYGYGPVFIDNYYGSGFSHHVGVSRDRSDRTYGRRTIGTNRVRSDQTRSDGNATTAQSGTRSDVRQKRSSDTNTSILRNRGRTGGTVQSSGTRTTTRSSTVRSRDTGRTRSSGTVTRGSSGTYSEGSRSRSRSRDNLRSQSQMLYFPDQGTLNNEAGVLDRIRNSRAPETEIAQPEQRSRRGSRILNSLMNAMERGAEIQMNTVRSSTRSRSGSGDSGSSTTRTRVRSRSDSGSSGSSGSSSSGRSRSRSRN